MIIKCREFELILQLIATEINLNIYNNDLPEIGNKTYALRKHFETDFLTTQSATQNSDRHSSFIE